MKVIADKLMNRMVQEGVISADDKESYAYIFITRSEQIITLSFLMILALIESFVFQTIAFLLFFYGIRQRAGGYHAKYFIQCFLGTLGIFFVFIKLIYPVMLHHMKITYFLLVVSVTILELIGAVNHPNIHWNESEYQISKLLTREIVMYEVSIIIFLILFNVNNSYIVFMIFGIVLSAILLFIAKISSMEG